MSRTWTLHKSMMKAMNTMEPNMGDRLVGYAALFIAGFLLAMQVFGV